MMHLSLPVIFLVLCVPCVLWEKSIHKKNKTENLLCIAYNTFLILISKKTFVCPT